MEYKEKIIELRKQHKTYSEIQILTGASRGEVSYVCTRYVLNNKQISSKNKKESVKSQQLTAKLLCSDECFIQAWNSSQEIKEFFHKIEAKNDSRDIRRIVSQAKKLDLDLTKFKRFKHYQENYIKENGQDTQSIKVRLVKERGHKCEHCGKKQWLNESIPLDLHHKNGNHKDNNESNLELRCPNCHRSAHGYIKNYETYFKDKSQNYRDVLKKSSPAGI